jgi:hypothetical protein
MRHVETWETQTRTQAGVLLVVSNVIKSIVSRLQVTRMQASPCGVVLEAVQEFENFVRYIVTRRARTDESAYSPLSSRLMSNILTAKLT